MIPVKWINQVKKKWSKRDQYVFLSVCILGLLTHMRIFIADIPNHDGMASIYFDQNMISSGRWFLSIACGITSYFTLPWLIGVISILYLAISAVLLHRVLEIKHTSTAILVGSLLVVYPTLASNYAYMFTADGYLLAVLLAILAVYLTEKGRYGFVLGGLALGFSMGIYQAYICIAMILCIYRVCKLWFFDRDVKKNLVRTSKYAGMGVIGVAVYFLCLQILLVVQNTSLSGYQGIGAESNASVLDSIYQMYLEFVIHTLQGNILMNQFFSVISLVALFLIAVVMLIWKLITTGNAKRVSVYIVGMIAVAILPICFNAVLLISPNVTYHALMKYQWVLIPICLLAVIDGCFRSNKKMQSLLAVTSLIMATMLCFTYVVVCNIAYFNLEKKYDKTYAYCLRMLDRMEETDGYEHGMPIAMIGVVGDHYLPSTDLTVGVTDSLIGVNGDYLFYKAEDYQAFFSYYFGVNIELVEIEEIPEIILTQEYVELNTFPKENSMKVVDGVLYIKMENQGD